MKCQSMRVILRPCEDGLGGELRAVVGHDHAWPATLRDEGSQLAGVARNAVSRGARVPTAQRRAACVPSALPRGRADKCG